MAKVSIFAVIGLLLIYAALCYSAVRTKSATMDEPGHAVDGFMVLRYGDHRIDPSNPPLWSQWAALPNSRDDLAVNLQSVEWKLLLEEFWQSYHWFIPTLYETPANHPVELLDRSRRMMLLFSLGLGIAIACWAWKLSGPWAAIVATAFFAFDPNLLAHGALVKNDVASALFFTTTAIAVWILGRHATMPRLLLLVIFCAAAMTTKFNGLIAPLTAVSLLAVRAFIAPPWQISKNRTAQSSSAKSALSVALALAVLLGTWGLVWASYGFRFGPTPDPNQHFNFQLLSAFTAKMQAVGRDSTYWPTLPEASRFKPGVVVRVTQWAWDHHLMPESWLAGFLYIYATGQFRIGYLLGHERGTGCWYYFPAAALFKTPIATLLAVVASIAIGTVSLHKKNRPASWEKYSLDLWSIACLTVPVFLYGIVAITSRNNVGIRHVFPIFPFIFIAIGIAADHARRLWRKAALIAALCLIICLAVESTRTYPNYLSFFNAAAGGSRGGIHLLADSNLDWGQDLSTLANWRKNHPQGTLYTHYFGVVPPAFYLDNDYLPLQLLDSPTAKPHWPAGPGYLAISVSYLQGLYLPPELAALYQPLLNVPPEAVLGGTIYIFRLPLPQTAPTH